VWAQWVVRVETGTPGGDEFAGPEASVGGSSGPTTSRPKEHPMPRLAPCLWFDGNAEEAASFYVSVFPDSKIGHIQRYPEDSPFPPSFAPGTAMTVDFALDGQPFTALNGGP
jgi:hypothetical protein